MYACFESKTFGVCNYVCNIEATHYSVLRVGAPVATALVNSGPFGEEMKNPLPMLLIRRKK